MEKEAGHSLSHLSLLGEGIESISWAKPWPSRMGEISTLCYHMFCRNIRYFWKKDLRRVFRSSALVEDPPAIPNEMVFQVVAASSSYRLMVEVIVTRASPGRVIFKALQRGGSQEAKCKLPEIAFSSFLCKALALQNGSREGPRQHSI